MRIGDLVWYYPYDQYGALDTDDRRVLTICSFTSYGVVLVNQSEITDEGAPTIRADDGQIFHLTDNEFMIYKLES